jgi:hypothetical protein
VHNQIHIKLEMRRHADAEALHKQALEAKQRNIGENHYSTYNAAMGLAACLFR